MVIDTNTSGIPHRALKRHTINRLSATTKTVLKPYIERFGAAYVGILLDWPSIVGEKFAKITQVAHLKFPLHSKTMGTLILRCTSASVPLLQMQSLQLVDRINQHFGYQAIAQIRFQAGLVRPAESPAKPPMPNLSAQQQSQITDLTQTIPNDTLRAALERLGEGILKQEIKNRAHKS